MYGGSLPSVNQNCRLSEASDGTEVLGIHGAFLSPAAVGAGHESHATAGDSVGPRTIAAEIVWDFLESEALADEWAAMDEFGLCEPSTSLDWTRALLRAHVTDTDTVFAVVLRVADRAVAIIPAMIRRERVKGLLDVATLQPLSELHNTHSDILWGQYSPDIVAAFFDAIDTLPVRWDVLRFGRFLESSSIARQVSNFLARSGMPHRIRREQPSFFLGLDLSYEQFLAARSTKFRNYLRRKSRQLRATGRVNVLRAGRDLTVAEAYRHLLAVEERSWKHSRGTAISVMPRQQLFYRHLFEGAARRGRLHLMLMYLDDVPIAFNLGITSGERYSYLKTSFDETFRHLSPATVLRARLVETLIADGIRALDFVGEPHQWEEQWTDTLRWHSSVLVFNRTPRAMLYRLLAGLWGLRNRTRDDHRVHYVDPRE